MRLDEIRKIDASCRDTLEREESERHKQFAATCKKFGLSLNTSKHLVGAVKGSLQGGTLDRKKGVFHSAPEKQALDRVWLDAPEPRASHRI